MSEEAHLKKAMTMVSNAQQRLQDRPDGWDVSRAEERLDDAMIELIKHRDQECGDEGGDNNVVAHCLECEAYLTHEEKVERSEGTYCESCAPMEVA